MANLIYLFGRDGSTDSYSNADLRQVSDRITPENAPSEVTIERDGDAVACIVGNPSPLPVRGTSVCMGQLFPATANWDVPGATPPDGTYALVRTDGDTVELVSDVVGSRTLYYRLFEDVFVASTSQRAVQHFAESFERDDEALAWMVSSGTLGPVGTWDERVEVLDRDSTVRLERATWQLDVESNDVTFAPINRSASAQRTRLDRTIEHACRSFDADASRWTLPLSGGIDSRELLTRFRGRDGLEAITWGTADALDDPDSDAAVARDLADAADVPHTYHTLPATPADPETVFERFVTAGEGRIDHVAGYVDGFDTFAGLAADGFHGIVRGDVAQSQTRVKSPMHVRFNVNGRLVEDYETLSERPVPGKDRQRWPARFDQRHGESLSTWRDRTYQAYRIPVTLASLTALKTPYVEVVNPLLSRPVVETIRTLPDSARNGKQLLRTDVLDRGPDVRVATNSATPSYEAIFGASDVIDHLHATLDTSSSRDVLGEELVDWTLDSLIERPLDESGTAPSGVEWPSIVDALKYSVASMMPASIITGFATYTTIEPPSVSIDTNHLAFRLYLIENMVRRLRRDTGVL